MVPRPVFIDEVEVLLLESYPVQARAIVSGISRPSATVSSGRSENPGPTGPSPSISPPRPTQGRSAPRYSSRSRRRWTSDRSRAATPPCSSTARSIRSRSDTPDSGERREVYTPAAPRATVGSGSTASMLAGHAPIVQRSRTPAFQAGNTGSNPVGGTQPGGVVKPGVHAGLSSRRSRVQIPSSPPRGLARGPVWSGSSVGRAPV